MKAVAALAVFSLLLSASAPAAELPKPTSGMSKLPVALSDDFQFRKTKLFFCSPQPPRLQTSKSRGLTRTAATPDASISFERSYRLFGAVTALDQRQRFGDYFDFFWRAKRDADVTVRLEYKQEKLRAFVQARELSYVHAKGNHKTEFAVIGDDFADDGRVIAWRCLLIEGGRIVAENRSYMWE
jgi:hypothetical protein